MHISPASPDNEAIRELRDSSKRLEKLTEQLSKSSERLEHLTNMLVGLTILLMALTIVIIIIPPDTPIWAKLISIFPVVVMVVWLFPLKKKE